MLFVNNDLPNQAIGVFYMKTAGDMKPGLICNIINSCSKWTYHIRSIKDRLQVSSSNVPCTGLFMLLARLAKLSSVSTDRIFKDATRHIYPLCTIKNPSFCCYRILQSYSCGGDAAFMTPTALKFYGQHPDTKLQCDTHCYIHHRRIASGRRSAGPRCFYENTRKEQA